MIPIPILYWSQISNDNNVFHPVFFFHPTLPILAYKKQFGEKCPIQIMGTNGIYDGWTWAVLDEAVSLGDCPTDLNPKKPIYAAFLPNVSFNIYPYEPFIGQFRLLPPDLTNITSGEEEEEKVEALLGPALEIGEKEVSSSESVSTPVIKLDLELNPEETLESYDSIPTPSVVPIVQPLPPTTDNGYNLGFVLLLVFLLILIIVLILCFYGELKSN
jgi:hypothetical protein